MSEPAGERPDSRLDAAEAILGVRFADRDVLRRAITHPSYADTHEAEGDYERLEFLGDAVLGFVVAEHLYAEHPDVPEGVLSKMRDAAVSGETLAATAEDLGLGAIVLLGKGVRDQGRRRWISILEDAFEALVAAVFLDAGLPAARSFVLRALAPHLGRNAVPERDAKSVLQETTQGQGRGLPVYTTVVQEGPPHDRSFTVEVTLDGCVLGRGTGATKKDAEKEAAAEALRTLG